jgi:3-phenylpropionate/trans-cinnamate dioxygenase alpha subunit
MAIDVDQLVDMDQGLISRRIFGDPEVYRLELERIFARCWLMLGHESQVARSGEFFLTRMGDESVIVTRDAGGQIRAVINSCRHRGNQVCRADAGRAHSFICTYHGWTYGLDGKLVGVPGFEDRYHEELDRDRWGLVLVAQVDTYKGLIFGSFDPGAPPLREYLGDACWSLDYVLDQRAGGTELVGGVFKWIINSNWKFGADNIRATTTTAASPTDRRRALATRRRFATADARVAAQMGPALDRASPRLGAGATALCAT